MTPMLRRCTPGKTESVRTNGEAIFVLVALSSASHHQLQTKSFICQAKPKFRKKPAKHFFDAAEPVGNKHAALCIALITGEGARPTTPRNQHRSLPFSCFSFNNFTNTNRQNKWQSLSSVLRGAETSPGKSDFFMPSQCHGTNSSTSSFRILEKVDFDAYVLVLR